MRRQKRTRRKTKFRGSKNPFNNKSMYIIIALICMIALNLGSMAITLSKNVMASNDPGAEEFQNESKLDKVKAVLGRVLNRKDDKNKENIQKKPEEDLKEDLATGHEDAADFIIIEDLEEYENFIVVRESGGNFDLADIPDPVNVKKVKVDPAKPYILAFHTHANEGYQPLKRTINYTSDNNQNVTQIGDIFSKVLETGSHKIVHNKTHHDVPSFNKSYSRSLHTIKTEMSKEKNIKFIFDIHRDGVTIKANTDKEYTEKIKKASERFSTTIDGKKVATFALVVGPDSANFNQNLNYAKYIKAVSDTIYPGLCKGIIIKKVGRFNQYLSDYSALVEVGANVNTIEESKETAKLLGEILDLVISKIIL